MEEFCKWIHFCRLSSENSNRSDIIAPNDDLDTVAVFSVLVAVVGGL